MRNRKVLGFAAMLGLGVVGLIGLGVDAIGQPANHPQLETAQSAASRLDQGAAPSTVVPATRVDIARSTEIFVIVTDSQRQVLASSASLSGETVLPPAGVFDYVRSNGEDRVTWQPAAGVRAWIVVERFSKGFVIAGRAPGDGEQSAYQALLWGSFAALGLAVLGSIGILVYR